MGTPSFAVSCLERLLKSDDEVVAVFTQPDKKVGRKQTLTPPPVRNSHRGLESQYTSRRAFGAMSPWSGSRRCGQI